jgi:integrase/recombinase XerD
MKQDWYNYAKQLPSAEKNVRKAPITERNKETILSFTRQLALEGLSQARIVRYLRVLPKIAAVGGKDFQDWTRVDAERVVEHYSRETRSEWTLHSIKSALKRFFKWLRASEDEYPPEVRWIRTNVRRDRIRLPGDGDIFDESDVRKLIDAAGNVRDRALIASLYESGCRIGELGTMRIRDVSFEKHGCRLNVIGKTGSRQVLVIQSAHYLAVWLSVHPRKGDREAPLWVSLSSTNRGDQLRYDAIRMMLAEVAKKAGVQKRHNPHLFRHSRASHLAPHLTEATMCSLFGWRLGSDMPSVYVHLSGKESDDALLRLNGLKVEDGRGTEAEASRCSRCDYINPASFQFCGRCGCALDVKAALEAEERQRLVAEKRVASDAVLNDLMRDEEVRELLKRKLVAMRD